MRHKFSKIVVLSAVIASTSLQGHAVPAMPGIIKYPTANGDSISVYLHGDERSHFFTSTDGYMLLRDEDDRFQYAIAIGDQVKPSGIVAADPGKRSVDAEALLSSIRKDAPFEVMAKASASNVSMQRNSSRVAPEAGESTFPTIGSPHVCIILVEFADNSFSVEDPAQAFNNVFNQQGYSLNGATGSVSDFFNASSNGQFTPVLDVLGPVKLSKQMSYYGGNDAWGNDKAPEEMVIDACTMLDSTVDFSIYDTDNDGIIDNVYVVYAGYGEAQGAPSNTIWPHSWAVYNGAGKVKYLDGKLLDHYATSNELRGRSGSVIDGIGTFCHEFSHVMGLPDLYATTYTTAFTPGKYSLMDQGSYNNNSNTPPTHSGYERYCLGWVEPKVLDAPETVSLKAISEEGHYDDVCIIKTPNDNEYFVLENRQQQSWDAYIPGHGMLIWHINYNPTVWASNICNNTPGRQYIDIEEADNIQSESSRSGDTFPGTKNVTSFTDDTQPSMLTWDNSKLDAPITGIEENNGVITFLFKGGVDIFDPVVTHEPTDDGEQITPGSFTARWNKVDKATSYLLSVYTKTGASASKSTSTSTNGNGITYLPGYDRKDVGDVDHFNVTGLTPASTYYFVVRATDGLNVSAASNETEITTLDPTLEYKQVTALEASSITADGFTANWEPLDEADGYMITLYTQQIGDPYIEIADFDNSALPTGWTSYGTSSETSNAGYAVTLPSRRFKINKSYIRTANYDDGIRSVSFWHRASVDDAENQIIIKGLVSGEWVDLTTVQPLTAEEGGATVSLDDVPSECTQINIMFQRKSGDVAIDDIAIGHGGPMVSTPIDGKADIDVGNVSTYTYTGLDENQPYGYSVKGYNSSMTSLPSDIISVVTSSQSGVDKIVDDTASLGIAVRDNRIVISSHKEAEITIHDVTGRYIQSAKISGSPWQSQPLSPGIYIISSDIESHLKIAVN